jgi:serine/threonine protein kinase
VEAQTEELETVWRQRGLALADLEERSDGTLVASDRKLAIESETILLTPMAAQAQACVISEEPVTLGRELGRGGMGAVRLGVQATVQREVAVKHVHQDAPHGAAALLKEAWVGAVLEHPNVVPVHTLIAVDGLPAIVMKRVEGTAWTRIIEDAALHARFSIRDPLEWHLRVLMQVCLAIELAHKKGILHLDLKPDNVMVGEFGEVYVLDWGLAAGLAHGPEWLVRAKDIRGVAGTPAYMAPELAMAAGDRVGERTDVYLLGAMLHHVLTGAAPHLAGNALAMLYKAYESVPPSYTDDVAPEMIAIVHRAMHRDPSARFASARALHDVLGEFLAQRESRRLTRQAEGAIGLYEQAVAQEADEARTSRLFGEVRFALRHAEQTWKQNPQVPVLLQRLLSSAFDRAVAKENPDSAAALLEEMPAPSAEHANAVEALRERLRQREVRVQALEHMQRELDITLGTKERRRLAVVLGVLWALISFALAYLSHTRILVMGFREALIQGGLMLAVLGPLGYVWRGALFRNKANARWQLALMLTFVVVESFWVGAWRLGIEFEQALAVTPFFYFFAFAAVAIMVDARLVLGALALALSGILCVLLPGNAFELIGVGGGLAVATLAWAWREGGRAA